MIFEFYGFYIRVTRTPTGKVVELAGDTDFSEDGTIHYHSPSGDPLSLAHLLQTDLDMTFHSELEELAALIDAHME
jgi:hypothetical protein